MTPRLPFAFALLLLSLAGCGSTDNLDRTPPTVEIVPPEESEIGAPLPVTVTASDQSYVTAVSLYVDGIFLERKTDTPYTFLWHSDFWGDGRKHILSATAVDSAGNIGLSSTVNVEVLRTSRPRVEVLAPLHNAVVRDQRVTLRWKPIDNAVSYTVQISDTTSMDYLIVDTQTKEPSLTVDLPDERTYRWRVLPVTVGNLLGAWSEPSLLHRTGAFTAVSGRGGFDIFRAITPAGDGGYLLAGSTHSRGTGGTLVKVNRTGTIEWSRFYAGADMAWFTSAAPAPSGGFIAAGQNSSREFPADRWFVRTDSSGNVLWNRTIVHDGAQGVNSIIRVRDGFIVCGYTETDSDRTDISLTKYDDQLELIWDRTIGGVYHDEAYRLLETSDGGLLLSGMSQKGTDRGSDRATVIRLNFLGEEKWRRDLRSPGGAAFRAAAEFRGRYYLCGTARTSTNKQDAIVAAFDSAGTHLWTKSYGGARDDDAADLAVVNGRIGICGSTASDSLGAQDAWLLVLDTEGKELAEQRYGGRYHDAATGIAPRENGFIIIGSTASYTSGSSDGFIIVTDLNGTVVPPSAP
ncbi:MAG: Ig-like domain-containing protein [Bacteroidetes bacterium]|nr:Ig-like domain-containing protein [Bacteroidota bacterium]